MAEHIVGKAVDFLRDGAMKRIDLEGSSVALARVGEKYFAFAAECPHYHGPLDEGLLCGFAVMCPWHHASFDIRDGALLEPPALNDLPSYPVRIEAGQIVVTLPETNQTEPSGKAVPGDTRNFIIIGGGAAGNACAEELRRGGFGGKVVQLSASATVPVDRPNLSKEYLSGSAPAEWVPLRGDLEWYKARDIDLRLNATVTGIDARAHTVQVEGAEPVRYDKLLIATGGTPRKLTSLPGAGAEGVFYLRDLADCDEIIAAAGQGKKAVVIGSSFIGMEVAASLAGGRGVEVTVVAIEAAPFEHVFGPEIGHVFVKQHQDNGVSIKLKSEAARIVESGGKVGGVELKSGELLPADFVVVGIGVRPATDFLAGSGLTLNGRDGSVQVDSELRTNLPDIYVAGDIARWNDGSPAGLRIEHWRVAEQHGIVAARNMLGGHETLQRRVPFFWTTHWDFTLGYAGHAETWDEIIVRGDLAKKEFTAFYVKGGKLLAAAASNRDADLLAAEAILRDGLLLSVDQMRDEGFDLGAILNKGE